MLFPVFLFGVLVRLWVGGFESDFAVEVRNNCYYLIICPLMFPTG